MRDRKKRNIIIGALCCLLVFMGIGYAILSQTLNISGTANMRGTWDIKITDISEASRTGKADPGTPTISTNGVSASFEANLWMPGDSITYNITVKNNGNIDAALKELVPSVENGVQQVKFSNNAVQGKVLRQSESYTFQVSVVFDEDATEIPQDSKTNPPKYTISLTFVQYTGNSLYTPTNETTDNSCFVINTAGEITGYDYNCGTVVTVPAEIDGIQVKSISETTFLNSYSALGYVDTKNSSSENIKGVYVFKSQRDYDLYIEYMVFDGHDKNGAKQEAIAQATEAGKTVEEMLKELGQAAGTTFNTLDEYVEYTFSEGKKELESDTNTKFVLMDSFEKTEDMQFISLVYLNPDGKGNITLSEGEDIEAPVSELDLSNAIYLKNIACLGHLPNIKTLNLTNMENANITLALNWITAYATSNKTNIKFDTLIIDSDTFNNLSTSGVGVIASYSELSNIFIKKGKTSTELNSHNGVFTSIHPHDEYTNVVIEDGIEKIGYNTFAGVKISKLSLPNTLKIIENAAFEDNKLTNASLGKLPSSLTSLATNAFSKNPDLTQITLTSPKDLEGWPNGGRVDGKTVTYER